MTFKGLVLSAIVMTAGCAPTSSPSSGEGGLYVYMRWPYLQNKADGYSTAITSDYINGATVILEWNRIEPAPGQYDWSSVDNWIKLIMSSDKKMALGVITGDLAPTWLYGDPYNVPHADFDFDKNEHGACAVLKQPIFWNATFQSRYKIFLKAISDHLYSMKNPLYPDKTAYDTLRMVKISGINVTTEEIRIASESPDTGVCHQSDAATIWAAFGYTPNIALSSWSAFSDMTKEVYPDKVLAVDIIHRNAFPDVDNNGHTTARSNDLDPVTQGIIDAGILKFGKQFMVKWDALSQAEILPPEVVQAGKRGAKIGWQMNYWMGMSGGGSGCLYAPFNIRACDTANDFAAIVANGINSGGSLIEVQVQDIPAHAAEFRRYKMR